jgi:hypothetical protein
MLVLFLGEWHIEMESRNVDMHVGVHNITLIPKRDDAMGCSNKGF